jgi:CTD nuclear envelope phosphatase 1
MNSLSLISVIGAAPAPIPQDTHRASTFSDDAQTRRQNIHENHIAQAAPQAQVRRTGIVMTKKEAQGLPSEVEKLENRNEETTPLLPRDNSDEKASNKSGTWLLPKRAAAAVVGALRMIISTIVAPGRYMIAYLYDDEGYLSAFFPLRRVGRIFNRKKRKGAVSVESSNENSVDLLGSNRRQRKKSDRNGPSTSGIDGEISNATLTSESEMDDDLLRSQGNNDLSQRRKSHRKANDKDGPATKSIRIRVSNEDLNQRRSRKTAGNAVVSNQQLQKLPPEAAAAALKSPTSPGVSSRTTKYPRAPIPPRPLVPRRQPSYVFSTLPSKLPRKTLIIDLDETLIHSMAKGGRMSTGHMVEVKLQTPVGVAGAMLGPQVPILYYVHKRPHCDEFLRKA